MTRRDILLFAATTLLCSCGLLQREDRSVFSSWGHQGLRDGEFVRPRALRVKDGEVYVIDTTGRMQVFGLTGNFLRGWLIPDGKHGTPTSLGFGIDGNLLVPDTHNSRILTYTRNGELLDSWGSYGTGDSEFIYPTGIVQGKDGLLYISEYGMGAERVRVFDSGKRVVRQWGGHGSALGQLNRATAITLDESQGVYVVDTANHRVQRFDMAGRLQSVIGGPGTAPGSLKFPHDLAVAQDGTLYVCEYGTHRVSAFSREGKFVACYGAPGRRKGQFNGPRGIGISGQGIVFVADTDNHRIQRFSPRHNV